MIGALKAAFSLLSSTSSDKAITSLVNRINLVAKSFSYNDKTSSATAEGVMGFIKGILDENKIPYQDVGFVKISRGKGTLNAIRQSLALEEKLANDQKKLDKDYKPPKSWTEKLGKMQTRDEFLDVVGASMRANQKYSKMVETTQAQIEREQEKLAELRKAYEESSGKLEKNHYLKMKKLESNIKVSEHKLENLQEKLTFAQKELDKAPVLSETQLETEPKYSKEMKKKYKTREEFEKGEDVQAIRDRNAQRIANEAIQREELARNYSKMKVTDAEKMAGGKGLLDYMYDVDENGNYVHQGLLEEIQGKHEKFTYDQILRMKAAAYGGMGGY